MRVMAPSVSPSAASRLASSQSQAARLQNAYSGCRSFVTRPHRPSGPRVDHARLARASPRLPTSPPASPLFTTLSRRRYHSYDHPSPSVQDSHFSPTEQAILSAAYRHVPEHGFSEHTLALGAEEAGYPDVSTNILPDGVFSLILWHLTTQRVALARRSEEIFKAAEGNKGGAAPAALGVGEKARRLTWERLTANGDIITRWQEALAIMAQPSYVPASLRELSQLADDILALAGDTSVDSSWYTKRASLSAIYAASELFMTSDETPGFVATREFLERRCNEANELGGYARSIGQWVGFTASAGVNVLRSKGVRI